MVEWIFYALRSGFFYFIRFAAFLWVKFYFKAAVCFLPQAAQTYGPSAVLSVGKFILVRFLMGIACYVVRGSGYYLLCCKRSRVLLVTL